MERVLFFLSLLIWNPRNQAIGLLLVMPQNFFMLFLNFSASAKLLDVTAMSSVATTMMVCSSAVHQMKAEWLAVDQSNPNSFIKTLLTSMYQPQPACFKPYSPFNNLSTFPSWPAFNTPLGGLM